MQTTTGFGDSRENLTVRRDLLGKSALHKALRVKINLVSTIADHLSNVLGSFESSKLNITRVLGDSQTNQLSRAGLTFCLDDSRLFILEGLLDKELGSLSLLLSNLLCFNSIVVFLAESEVGNGNIFKDDVEIRGTVGKDLTDHAGDLLTLCDKLRGVELSNNALESFVNDRGENTLIIVLAEGSEDGGEMGSDRSEKDTKSDINSLEITSTSGRADSLRLGTDVENEGFFDHRNTKMSTFFNNGILNTSELVEKNSAVTGINVIQSSADTISNSGSTSHESDDTREEVTTLAGTLSVLLEDGRSMGKMRR